MKRVCEGTSHLTDNMKTEIRQVNILVIRYDTSLLLTEYEGRTREYCGFDSHRRQEIFSLPPVVP